MTYVPKVDDFVFMAIIDNPTAMSLITKVSENGFVYIPVSSTFAERTLDYKSNEYQYITKDSLVSFADTATKYGAISLYVTVSNKHGKKKNAKTYIQKLKEYIMKNYTITEAELKPGGTS